MLEEVLVWVVELVVVTEVELVPVTLEVLVEVTVVVTVEVNVEVTEDVAVLVAEVVVVEPTGADTQVFTKIAGVEVTSVFRERHAFTPGSTIRLQADASRAHLFDAASGKALVA